MEVSRRDNDEICSGDESEDAVSNLDLWLNVHPCGDMEDAEQRLPWRL
jgi:hypothetical protein